MYWNLGTLIRQNCPIFDMIIKQSMQTKQVNFVIVIRVHKVLVVQKLENAIHRIDCYPIDNC